MTVRSLALSFAAMATLAACGSTDPNLDDFTLVADSAAYTAPSLVQLELTNMSGRTVNTGVCGTLQSRAGGAWA